MHGSEVLGSEILCGSVAHGSKVAVAGADPGIRRVFLPHPFPESHTHSLKITPLMTHLAHIALLTAQLILAQE